MNRDRLQKGQQDSSSQDRCQVPNGKGRACEEQREWEVAEGPWAGVGQGVSLGNQDVTLTEYQEKEKFL